MREFLQKPWVVVVFFLVICSLVYGYIKEGHDSDILKCAMQNGYESRPSGKFMSDEVVWVRVTCKRCGGCEFDRSATEPVKLR